METTHSREHPESSMSNAVYSHCKVYSSILKHRNIKICKNMRSRRTWAKGRGRKSLMYCKIEFNNELHNTNS